MAMAALRQATRRLACQQRPAIHRAAVAEQPRRLLHRGSSAVGRNFSLAEEQRRMLPRLLHGGPPAVGRAYSRQFSSFHHEPNPSTIMETAKDVYELYDKTNDFIYKILVTTLKLTLAGAVVLDCCRDQCLLNIARVMLRLEPREGFKFLRGGKEGTCHECGHDLGEGMCQQQQKKQ